MNKSRAIPSRSRSSSQRSSLSTSRVIEQAKELIQAGKPDEAIQLLQPLAKQFRRDAEIQYYLATAYYEAGDLWESIPYYRNALDLSRDAELWIILGFVYLELDLKMLGLHALRWTIQTNPKHPALEKAYQVIPGIESQLVRIADNLNLPVYVTQKGLVLLEEGQIALHSHNYVECIAINRRAIKLLGSYPPPHNNLSLALFFHGQPQEATQTARHVLQNHPDNTQAMANLIRFLAWSGEEMQARSVWETLKQQPLKLVDLQMKVMEAAAIIEDDQMVLQLAQKLKPNIREDQGKLRSVRFYQAIAEANLGMPSARRSLSRCKEHGPLIEEIINALKQRKTGLGWAPRFPYFTPAELMPAAEFDKFIKLLQGQKKISPPRFRKEVESFTGRFPQIVLIGKKIILEQQHDEAGIQLLKAVGTPAAYAALREFGLSQLGSDEARRRAMFALLEEGQIQSGENLRMWQNGEWREIQLRSYEVTDEAYPEYSPQVVELQNRALKIYQKNNLAAAEKLFLSILSIDPRVKEAYNNLGTIYIRQEKDEQAKTMFEQALAIDPHYVMARCNLAILLLGDDNTEAAEKMVAPLADIQRITPHALSMLCYVHARIALIKEQYNEARSQLEMAVQTNPDFKPAQDLLEHLKMMENLRAGFGSWGERMKKRQRATRIRLQNQLSTPAPSLADALGIYTKESLTGIGRAALPEGGWSTLKKAQLLRYLVESLPATDNLKRLIENLSPNECRALRQMLERGGYIPWAEFDAAFGNDLEESPYWQYHQPESLMGRLRIRGLLVETSVDGQLVMTIPLELRVRLLSLLPAEGA